MHQNVMQKRLQACTNSIPTWIVLLCAQTINVITLTCLILYAMKAFTLFKHATEVNQSCHTIIGYKMAPTTKQTLNIKGMITYQHIELEAFTLAEVLNEQEVINLLDKYCFQ